LLKQCNNLFLRNKKHRYKKYLKKESERKKEEKEIKKPIKSFNKFYISNIKTFLYCL